MTLYCVSAPAEDGGTDFIAVSADTPDAALDDVSSYLGIPSRQLHVEPLEDVIESQYGGLALLTTI